MSQRTYKYVDVSWRLHQLKKSSLFEQTSRICRTGSTSWLQFANASKSGVENTLLVITRQNQVSATYRQSDTWTEIGASTTGVVTCTIRRWRRAKSCHNHYQLSSQLVVCAVGGMVPCGAIPTEKLVNQVHRVKMFEIYLKMTILMKQHPYKSSQTRRNFSLNISDGIRMSSEYQYDVCFHTLFKLNLGSRQLPSFFIILDDVESDKIKVDDNDSESVVEHVKEIIRKLSPECDTIDILLEL
ncbi:11896_t:CDS:2 [Funneliformis geosporum]|uniref:11896_t:CDS:1 n=1 Tax=Funneliformis geosporum TaxID=1117311 RepID=A0A9W4SG66_9GLOM|nr:11896_t:CDS:2 [Funneliformis geosporum]